MSILVLLNMQNFVRAMKRRSVTRKVAVVALRTSQKEWGISMKMTLPYFGFSSIHILITFA